MLQAKPCFSSGSLQTREDHDATARHEVHGPDANPSGVLAIPRSEGLIGIPFALWHRGLTPWKLAACCTGCCTDTVRVPLFQKTSSAGGLYVNTIHIYVSMYAYVYIYIYIDICIDICEHVYRSVLSGHLCRIIRGPSKYTAWYLGP